MFPKNERIFSSTLTIKRLETAKYIKCMKTFLSMGGGWGIGRGGIERGGIGRGGGGIYIISASHIIGLKVDFWVALYMSNCIDAYLLIMTRHRGIILTPGITELVTLFAISESLAEGGFEPLNIRSMEGIFQLSYPYTYGKSLGIILTSTKSSTSTDTVTLF